MAKENFVFLHGQIYDKPKLSIDENGVPRRASFAIKVLRRPAVRGAGAISTGKLSLDVPVIMTTDESLIRTCGTLCKGDMVDVRGILTTRDIVKKSICPNGHEVAWEGNFVFITPLYICRHETELSDEKGMALLRDRAEVSNLAIVLGSLCREPELHEFVGENNRKSNVCQYQIAANRRYHIRDNRHEHEKTDYPWVKTSGKQALEDNARLHVGSTVLLNGAIQTREIERDIVCPVCGAAYRIKESVCELYPYFVEYLMNCLPREEEPKEIIENAEAPAIVAE